MPKTIEYLSQPAAVSMADQWFEVASIDHFWIRRRFRVLQSMADQYIQKAREMAEIGCGNGLLQKQIEIGYQRHVTGLDLNVYALERNVSTSRVCCYDIQDRNPNLQGAFDLIFLFDVLEHIENEGAFLNALLFHLAADGTVVINVPAGPWAFSAYDRAAGHVRRYLAGSLTNAAQRNALDVIAWTYWGLPLVPTLALRKIWLSLSREQNSTIRKGFDSRSPFVNRVFATLSSLECIPQRVLGTSLMAVLKKRTAGGPDGR